MNPPARILTMENDQIRGRVQKTSPSKLAKHMLEKFILIPGRTTDQGCGVSEGKFGERYQNAINALQVASGDMVRLGLSEGDLVRLTGEQGQKVDVCITAAKKDELPEGLLFIAYGDISSRLMSGDTHGSGMPTSKGMEVTMELVSKSGASQ